MKIYVYSLRYYDEESIFKDLCAKYGYTYEGTPDVQNMENAELAKGCEAVSVIASPLPDEVLEKWASMGVKYLNTRSIGTDHINLEKCKELGISVGHAIYSPEGVADYTIMLMLMTCRKFTHILKRSEVQDYTFRAKLGKELSRCTVGVIGTGRIGKTVVKHLQGFGCKVLCYDIFKNDEVAQIADYVELDELYAKSDIVTLHCPATSDNYHMIDDEAIGKMKDGAIVINCARGTLLDTAALIRGLESGKLYGAALDVIENEGDIYFLDRIGDVISTHHDMAILQSFPNVIVAPHTASYTDQQVLETTTCVFDFIKAKEAGEKTNLEV